MKRKIFMLMLLVAGLTLSAAAQEKELIARQKKQEKIIEQAYKKKKISELEYNKLKREQEVIKETIEKFAADDVWTAKEKNALHDKLQRADKRLSRYKTNGEVY